MMEDIRIYLYENGSLTKLNNGHLYHKNKSIEEADRRLNLYNDFTKKYRTVDYYNQYVFVKYTDKWQSHIVQISEISNNQVNVIWKKKDS